MSKRTKLNKSWAKKARGEYKAKVWKQELPSYYGTKYTTSASGKVYENLVPWYKMQKRNYTVNEDLVAYLQHFFGGLF